MARSSMLPADSRGFILSRLPHRPPFLWVDEVVMLEEDRLVATTTISADLDLFRGHYPHYPLMPGVLLCEAVFQAGALLIAERLRAEGEGDVSPAGVPVLTRILGARFKREVRPGDVIRIEVRLKEQVGPAWFLAGKVLVHERTAVTVDFACTLKVGETEAGP
ncbi:MAG: 3-hydroxyacyl-ACP dehydratase FabZ family protein [Thermodesulfobacteriota bacterium]